MITSDYSYNHCLGSVIFKALGRYYIQQGEGRSFHPDLTPPKLAWKEETHSQMFSPNCCQLAHLLRIQLWFWKAIYSLSYIPFGKISYKFYFYLTLLIRKRNCMKLQSYNWMIDYRLHCKPIPCNENRVFPVKFSHREIPVIKTGFPVMKTGFSLCGKLHREFPVLALYCPCTGLQCCQKQ